MENTKKPPKLEKIDGGKKQPETQKEEASTENCAFINVLPLIKMTIRRIEREKKIKLVNPQ